MKNLLLISNLSANNKILVEYAATFCKHYNCKLHILHLSKFSQPVLMSSPHFYNTNEIQNDKIQESDLISKIDKITSSIIDREFIKVTIKEGNQEKILNTFINENFIDMIMLGNKDLENESDFNDHKNILWNLIETPLIIIPEFQVFSSLDTFNFLTKYTANDLEYIIALSKLFNDSKIKITHKEDSNSALNIKKENWKNYLENKIPNRVSHEKIDKEVSDYIRSENFAAFKIFDAFVFTTHKRKFWARIFDQSTTLNYLVGLEIPSIIFKLES